MIQFSNRLTITQNTSELGHFPLMMIRRVRKHRTPVVKTIKVAVGSHLMSFKLETERLVARKRAISLMAQLHDLAKSLIPPTQTTRTSSSAHVPLDSHIEPITSEISHFRALSDGTTGQDAFSSLHAFDFMSHDFESRMDDPLVNNDLQVDDFFEDDNGMGCSLDLSDHGSRNCIG
jgi:hypothetical protein